MCVRSLAQLLRGCERGPVAERGDPALQEGPPRLDGEVAAPARCRHEPRGRPLELLVADQGTQLGVGLQTGLQVDELLKLRGSHLLISLPIMGHLFG